MTTETKKSGPQYDDAVTDHGVDVPAWIERDITVGDCQEIAYGGCASGAYMPAVTYHTARETMGHYGDAVLQYIEDMMDELPQPAKGESWSGIAVFYLSVAVEMWVRDAMDQMGVEER